MIAASPDQDFHSIKRRPVDTLLRTEPKGESPRGELSKAGSKAGSRTEYPPPDNLSMHCAEPPHLKYNITLVEGGVLLTIWEPAPKSEVRVKPFLFMSRHRLPSEGEARKLLNHYLSVYKRAVQRS
jgi:hypothetical protein